MRDLRVSAIQSDLTWEDPEANRAAFAQKLSELKDRTDLVVLPEMFTTGFSMRTQELAEKMNGPTVHWMKEQAASINAAVNGSVIISEDGKFFNRSLFVFPEGKVEYYDKRHLFSMANEDAHFSGGNERRIVSVNGWRICLQVCYDLRFPVWSRNRKDYDVLIYVANWPEARTSAWSTLLCARALENQCYVIGVNRVGEDGMKINYSGASIILDPKGQPIGNIPLHKEYCGMATLSFQELEDFRQKFPLSKDSDNFEIEL